LFNHRNKSTQLIADWCVHLEVRSIV
jgi:hypothetical protein